MSEKNLQLEDKVKYPDLERAIKEIKDDFAMPLMDEVVVTPIMHVVGEIINLPTSLNHLTSREIHGIERQVRECQRVLEEISYDYVQSIITKPTPSKVFRILDSSNRFEQSLKRVIGKPIKLPDGTETTITQEVADCLLKYRFSIGTPPVTPEGIRTIEKIVFGGELTDIYAFRDLLGGSGIVFDRFLTTINQLVEQSTHYTTAQEKRSFSRESADFSNLEGIRGFTKSIVTGSTNTAIRLIKDQLLSQHSNGSHPIRVIEDSDKLGDGLIKKMTEDQKSVFVVRVKSAEPGTFAQDRLLPKWRGVIGRLIIIDDSENARRSGTTIVYSLHPGITEALDKFHVKDSGTPANTQMNLRLILEKFRGSDLKSLRANVQKKIIQIEKSGVADKPVDEVRKKEWLTTGQKDLFSLKEFMKFLDFIEKVKNGSEKEFEEMQSALIEKVEDNTEEYFFKALKGKGYECISVPQGGGRRELGLVGKFHLKKHQIELEKVRGDKLEDYKERLAGLKELHGISEDSTDVERNALARALQQRQSPNHSIRAQETSGSNSLLQRFGASAKESLHKRTKGVESALKKLDHFVDKVTSANITGEASAVFSERVFKALGISSASKILERDKFRTLGNGVRALQGTVRNLVARGTYSAEKALQSAQRGMEVRSLTLAEQMINDLEKGSFFPSIAQCEVGWTFNDVLDETDFPPKNYINIRMDESGQMDPSSLEKHLEDVKESLIHFPELFELYCSSIILIINDPHNPTSTVASNKVKLGLLDIAAYYKITILSDEAYRKQVSSEIKEKQGDASLSEFYEQNRARFSRPITIYTSLPTTKWAIGAGRRTGVLVSNDTATYEDGTNFGDFVRSGIDSVNTMSLYMDNETYRTGIVVKKVCKQLEPALILENPAKAIDKILEKDFSDFEAESFVPAVYFALLEARNDLDRLKIRGALEPDYKIYLSDFIKDLKNLRLDKRTQRDGAARAKAANNALERTAIDYPELAGRFIKPEGPFYFCVRLDQAGADLSIQPFLEAIAQARKIDVVPRASGYIRFSFGGETDGTPKGYENLSLAIETDLRLIFKYWKEFKEKRTELHKAKDLNPEANALKALFPGGNIEFARAAEDKKALLDQLKEYKGPKKKKLAFDISASAAKYVSSIEPDSNAHIVTIRGVKCKDVNEFVRSKPFQQLFNHYLLKVKAKIPAIQHLSNREVVAFYGALQFAEKFETRVFKDSEKEIFSQITSEVSRIWFSQNTRKILADSFGNAESDTQGKALMGSERVLHAYITRFLKAFLSEEEEAALDIRPTFQAGYQSIEGIKANDNLPFWARSIIGSSEFAGQTMPTDPSPEMVTGGTARVAGVDRGIFRRDGDDEMSPPSEFFADRLNKFAEVMNPKDYICKMAQIGGTKVLLVMHRSYSHYLVEELRLLPQVDLSGEDAKGRPLFDLHNLRPDAISFLGLPTKVMGEDYRIGYFYDQGSDGENIPVSWVNRENITDYMGYLKKTILTVSNEKVTEMGGLSVHGAAVTIVAKNGLRKTAVWAGDSGTGKSESIIAMIEQIIEGMGGADRIESIELLAGDMLSLWEGEDAEGKKDIYMFGTEEGDFMRMTDIPDDWRLRVRDRIENGSKTNINDKKNPRITVGGLCDPERILRPTRVNIFCIANNYEKPARSSFVEVENPVNLMEQYIRGYRGEKGTSGDQPNFYASVKYGKTADKDEILKKYEETLDDLLGWDVILDERGKPANATLNFNDIEGRVFEAKRMVNDLFVGKMVEIGGKECEIGATRYSCRENKYFVTVQGKGGAKKEIPLLREDIFNKIYSPIASTYGGHPFIDPRKQRKPLSRFGKLMKEAGVITGVIHTQLAIKGQQFAGPAAASQSVFKFILEDDRINERFQKHRKKVNSRLREKYGEAIIGQEDIPVETEAFNLYLLERQESDAIRLVDQKGETIPLKTPLYEYDSAAKHMEFNPSLITQEMKNAITGVCEDDEYNLINLDDHTFDLSKYGHIQSWDSKEELIYQILLTHGTMQLGYDSRVIEQRIADVKKAEKIAKEIIKEKGLNRFAN